MTDDEGGWDRVGAWLRREMHAQGLSMGKLERDSGVAYQTLRKLLDGQPITRRERLVPLARALGYQHDAFDAVRAGEEPARIDQVIDLPLLDGSADARLSAVEQELAQVREGLAAVVRRLDEGAGSP